MIFRRRRKKAILRIFLYVFFSDAHVETWTDDLAGGILFQDDSYPVHAYNDRVQAQDRFLNLTYRTPNVIKTPERLLRANAAVALARGHPGGPQQLVHHVRARFMFSRNPEFFICRAGLL